MHYQGNSSLCQGSQGVKILAKTSHFALADVTHHVLDLLSQHSKIVMSLSCQQMLQVATLMPEDHNVTAALQHLPFVLLEPL